MSDAKEKLRQDILRWKTLSRKELVQQFKILGIEHRNNSPSSQSAARSIKAKHNTKQGYIYRVSFQFPKHMVFVHKGVGKGVPAHFAGSFHTNRKPKEWYNPVMEKRTERLADTLAEDYSEMALNNIFIN